MYRLFLGALLLSACLALAGCSASSPATQDAPAPDTDTESPRPGWYRANPPLGTSASGGWNSHAAALGADSADAVAAALRRARLHMESGLSGSLEDMRRELVQSGGEGSDALADPAFVMALRKAEDGLGGRSGTARTEARQVENRSSWRAFASVTLDKPALTAYLDNALSAHAAAWNSLKGSAAYRTWGAGAS